MRALAYSTRLIFVFALALTATTTSVDAQPVRGRINTETRLVTAMRQREQTLLDALGSKDTAAIAGVLADDFAQYSLNHDMQLTPRADWLRNLAAHPLGKVRLENISAIDHGATLVVNFNMRITDARDATQSFAVVDVFAKPQGANDWMLSQRYIATPGSDAAAPGDNAPDTSAPPKRI